MKTHAKSKTLQFSSFYCLPAVVFVVKNEHRNGDFSVSKELKFTITGLLEL